MDAIRVTLTTTNPTLKHKILALADYDNATKLHDAIKDWIMGIFPKYQNTKPDPHYQAKLLARSDSFD